MCIRDRSSTLIAGPCSIESREQLEQVADVLVRHHVPFIRGGAFKPRTSPYSYQGLGAEGLRMLSEVGRQYGLLTISEILDPRDVQDLSLIHISLADSTIYVENTTNIAYSSADERPVIELFSKTELRQVSLKLGDKVYMAEKLDEHHHRVTLDYNQACGQFSADVCENGALINVVTITIRSRVGTINDDNGFFD